MGVNALPWERMCERRKYHSSPQHRSLSSETAARALICSKGAIRRKEHEKELEFTVSFDPSRKIIYRIELPRLQYIFCYVLCAGREDLDRVNCKGNSCREVLWPCGSTRDASLWCQKIDLGQLLQNIPFAVRQQTTSQGSNLYLQ